MAARKTSAGSPARGKKATAPLMREALMLSLQREAGKGSKTPRSQMVADALVDAAIKGEMAAVREVFHRIDGKTAEALGGEERRGPGELRIRWLTAEDEVPGADKIHTDKIRKEPKTPRS
ncbi:MAG TPA: hypothetical protein VLA85_20080 [Verrucomicrobiae bacterium]|jgi:hypothetical protein|nr:hypothetical protein [Verrucomicrobiae bacterium]